MINFYNQLTEVSLAVLVIGASVLVFTVCLWIYQRFLGKLRMEPGSGDVAQIYGGAIGTVFALIFAFVVIAVWQNFDRVGSTVSTEATVLHNIYRNLDAYPPAFRDQTRQDLKDYVQEVLEVEWNQMTTTGQDEKAHALVTKLNHAIVLYRPKDLSELPIQQYMIQLVAQNRGLRHDRLKGAEPYLDKAMWLSLTLGTGILLIFSCMLNMPSKRQHFLVNGVLGASMGLVFYLLLVYNFPMQGPGCITSDPLRDLPAKYWLIK